MSKEALAGAALPVLFGGQGPNEGQVKIDTGRSLQPGARDGGPACGFAAGGVAVAARPNQIDWPGLEMNGHKILRYNVLETALDTVTDHVRHGIHQFQITQVTILFFFTQSLHLFLIIMDAFL